MVWEPDSPSRRLSRATLVAAVVTAVLLGFAVASAVARTAKPVISGLAASPASVASGGTTTVSASVTGAAECTLTATKPVQGLPVTVPCESGSVSRSIEMPVNPGRKSLAYTLTLTATGAGGSAKAKTTVVVLDKAESPGDGRALAAGSEFTCAVLTSGHVACWGLNTNGQLGNGNQSTADVPVEVQGIDDATEVSAGHAHACALLSTGSVECWGLNGNGQLGNDSETSSDFPVEVQGITDASEVSAGWDSTCALLATGSVDCWGMGEGRLGDGSEASSDTPVEAAGITDATEVSAGWDHTCARLSTGRLLCWGQNGKGQLGTGSSSSFAYDSPVEVQGIAGAAAVSAGGEAADDPYTCALLSTGHVECWGANKEGQLGDGTTLNTTSPEEAQGISEATELGTHSEHSCALLSSGHIDCWGANGYGALGIGDRDSSDVPVAVQSIATAVSVAVGGRHTCALLSTGHAECWGGGANGALGDGKTTKFVTQPVEVSGI
jgi:alpha-tubulin suppressor-like RCC1 family protein